MKNMLNIVLFVSIVLLFNGCVQKQYIDVTDSINNINAANIYDFGKVEVNDKTQKDIQFKTDHIPIRNISEVSFANLIKNDLEFYFNNKLNYSSGKLLKINIYEAEPYWLLNPIDNIPIIGIVGISDPKNYIVYIRLELQIIENNKIVKRNFHNDRIVITNSAATEKDLIEGYKRLVSQYRISFFSNLEELRILDKNIIKEIK